MTVFENYVGWKLGYIESLSISNSSIFPWILVNSQVPLRTKFDFILGHLYIKHTQCWRVNMVINDLWSRLLQLRLVLEHFLHYNKEWDNCSIFFSIHSNNDWYMYHLLRIFLSQLWCNHNFIRTIWNEVTVKRQTYCT